MAKPSGNTAGVLNSYSKSSKSINLRKAIFELLDGDGQSNPLLTPKQICKLLDLSYKQYHNYVSKCKWEWKYYYKNERGSKCSNLHCFKAKVKFEEPLTQALRQFVRLDLEKGGVFGWVPSKAKNRFFVWKGRLGRAVWFESGTVLLHVKRPGNLGKAKQLFCDAFVNTGLITDFKLLNPVLERIRPKSGHFPYEAGERLPYMVIRDFEQSHGIVIKLGDRTHPDAVEVIASFTETWDAALEKLSKLDDLDKVHDCLKKITGVLSQLVDLEAGGARAEKGNSPGGGKDEYVA